MNTSRGRKLSAGSRKARLRITVMAMTAAQAETTVRRLSEALGHTCAELGGPIPLAKRRGEFQPNSRDITLGPERTWRNVAIHSRVLVALEPTEETRKALEVFNFPDSVRVELAC